MNQRDSASDTRFEQIVDVMLLRDAQKLRAVGGDQLFVGSDDVLSGAQRTLGKIIGRHNASDCFDHDPDLGVIDNLLEILRPLLGIRGAFQTLNIHDVLDVEPGARLALDCRTVL